MTTPFADAHIPPELHLTFWYPCAAKRDMSDQVRLAADRSLVDRSPVMINMLDLRFVQIGENGCKD